MFKGIDPDAPADEIYMFCVTIYLNRFEFDHQILWIAIRMVVE